MDDGLEEIQSILSETNNNNPTRTGSDETHENLASGGRETEEVSTIHIGSDQELAKEGRASESKEGNNGASNGGGASIIKNLIANILHPHNGGEDQQQEGGNKSIFSKTIGDAAPEAEEASLLIHSIVHD